MIRNAPTMAFARIHPSGAAFLLGLLALSAGLTGQWLVGARHDVVLATRWYAGAIALMLVGWHRTVRIHRLVPAAADASQPATARTCPQPRKLEAVYRWIERGRIHLLLTALAINLSSVAVMRSVGYDSWLAGLGWTASVFMLIAAGLGERRHALPSESDAPDATERNDARISRRTEWLLVLLIVAVGAAMRLYRLGDWTTGVHGDEGEAGMEALSILEGKPVSPFASGWFTQPNFYYWCIALMMKVFGTDLFGLRMFSATAGTLLLLPFYWLVRRWFGVRTALIGGSLLAVSDVAVHFSRLELSSITTPLFLVVGFLFFFRGLETRRALDFVLAGFGHMATLCFYFAGRLTPIMVLAFVVYLFLVMPVLRVPSAYRRLRDSSPRRRRLSLAAQAATAQLDALREYAIPLLFYAVACVCFASPLASYYSDHRPQLSARPLEKLIFNNEDRMTAQYGVSHAPLYFGLSMPDPGDALPMPFAFEPTPFSLRIVDDAFWGRVLWAQLQTTLSMLTYRSDASTFFTFTGEAVAKPIEAALIVLGAAWALWLWRDARMAALSIWFWSTIFAGGVLTIDAPYMPRCIGIIAPMAVFAAIYLNKLIAEWLDYAATRSASGKPSRVARYAATATVGALIGFLAWQNFYDYYVRYLGPWVFRASTGQAIFVHAMNDRITAEGRPAPEFLNLGSNYIYWNHGTNRFLNHGKLGRDVKNPGDALAVGEDSGRDIVFVIWPMNLSNLPAIKSRYPNGSEESFYYGRPDEPEPLLVSYRVRREHIAGSRIEGVPRR
ncbi:MAG: glycosyltransferase family 39 protein [Casimicrobiaceae bacterium]